MALLQHPSIPAQFPSKVTAPLQAGHKEQVEDYVSEIISCTGPFGRSRKTVHAAPAPKLLRMMQQFKSFQKLLAIPSLPGLTSSTSRPPTWLPSCPKLRISPNLPKAGSSAPPCTPTMALVSLAISTPTPVKLSTLTPSRSRAKVLHKFLRMTSSVVWFPRTISVAGIVFNSAGLLLVKLPLPPNW